MRSDNEPEEPRSEAPSGASRRRQTPSSKPRGPPSVSTPGMQSEMDILPDDEIVDIKAARRGNILNNQDVPRVVDTTAETLGIQFERFLEKYRHTVPVEEEHVSDGVAALLRIRRRQQWRRRSL